MSRKLSVRILTLAVALLMLVSAAACASGADDQPEQTTPTADTTPAPAGDSGNSDITPPAQDTEVELKPDLPTVDYTGQTLTFLEREIQIGSNVDVFFTEIYADISKAETVSDAVYNRNMDINQKYGIELVSVREMDAKIHDTFSKSADAGDKICDVLHANGGTTMKLAIKGYLRDMNTLDHVNYENPWWMGMVMETTAMSGKNAFAIGDTNLQAFTAVSAIYFNKQMVEDLSLDNIYPIVEEGKWTLDKMYTYSQAAVAELDGDDKMTPNDRYGLLFNAYVWQPLFYGSGTALVEHDAAGGVFLNFKNETVMNNLTKVVDYLADDKTNACTSWMSLGKQEDFFLSGHSMFYIQLMYSTLDMRQGELDFGILPIPKLDESQDGYYHYVHNKSSYTAVPKINFDLEKTGIILEDLAYHSYKTVRPSFFDVLLDGKVARDEESTEMLDYVYENVYVCLLRPMTDVGLTTDNVVRSLITAKTGSGSLASTIKRAEAMWERTLNNIVKSFEEKMDE